MSAHSVGSAVVTDGDRVCGIVTRVDLVRADAELAHWIGSISVPAVEHANT
jgi:hypothetical protein